MVELVRSSTWMDNQYEKIERILEETLKWYVGPEDRIINIESKNNNGLNRFWIYIERK